MLYIYNIECLSASVQEAFLTVVDRAGESLCIITVADLDYTVAECLDKLVPMEIKDFIPQTGENGEAFLLMDLDDLEVDPFLAQLRKNEIYIAHKCMVTEKNRNVKVRKLINEVGEEHKFVSQLASLRQMLEIAGGFHEDDYNQLLWLTFVQKKQMAEDLLSYASRVAIPPTTIDETLKELNNAILALIVSRGRK